MLPNYITSKFNTVRGVEPKELNIRKKLYIYTALDNNKNHICILNITQKSRVLQKDIEIFEDIFKKLQKLKNISFLDKLIYIESPLCSKAKTKLQNLNWNVINENI
ncbi:MAG: hypothetical protein U9Q33_04645 [Campylobacterota bacterium]|nr:hypothetical protein [Campylobacterota bacterium]